MTYRSSSNFYIKLLLIDFFGHIKLVQQFLLLLSKQISQNITAGETFYQSTLFLFYLTDELITCWFSNSDDSNSVTL
jgi:hypothetical protein